MCCGSLDNIIACPNHITVIYFNRIMCPYQFAVLFAKAGQIIKQHDTQCYTRK